MDKFESIRQMVAPFTMLGHNRLRGLYGGIIKVVKEGIAGDIVECGVAKGGSAALMALTLKYLGDNRLVWAYDSFQGLPPPGAEDGEEAQGWAGRCKATLAEVREVLVSLGVLENCRLVAGLFQDTLPSAEVGTIALLHLDGDWYESTKCCLEHLYERVSPNGLVQIDDYGHWSGCRQAVDEFFEPRGYLVWEVLDYTGIRFQKGA